MSGDILFLAHRIPFPPDRGDKIRSHHVLEALAKRAPIHVGCLAENEDDLAEQPHLAAIARSHWMPMRAKPLPVAGLEALFRREPISVAAFSDATLAAWVRKTLEDNPVKAIYVFSGQMGQYIPEGWPGRVVIDFADVDSAKFEAYTQGAAAPRSWVYGREARLLAAMERELVQRADVSLLVSEEEAELLRERTGARGPIFAMRNGIDCERFDPKLVSPKAELARTPGPHFVFTGQMDYAPNVAAVERFAQRILPAIRAIMPDAAFHIVGRAPTPRVLDLAHEPGTRVWGAVPDTRPFLAGAGIAVAPLTIARGVQNKVLEAMAMARPVLLSPEAATGIDAEDGTHFVTCADDRAFVENALTLASSPARCQTIGQAARRHVLATASWEATLRDLPLHLGLDGEAADDHAA